MKKTVGERIRRLRTSRGYTQDYVAAELGMTGSAYAKIERGETDPPVSRLMDIAAVFKINISELFTNQEAEDTSGKYGFATKADIAQIIFMIKELKEEIDKLKNPAQPKKITRKKIKK